MSDYNVSIADFKNKNRIVMTDTLYQYDYGQKLQIVNIAALPQTFEAHFSNVQHGGVSITVTGMDGIVDIPNSLLMTGKRIYCWIYVTEPGSGETVYQILLPVQHRPMPEYYDVTDVGVFDSVVQQVGDYAATATAGATNATASAAAAATSASEAAASASAAETAKNAAETAQGKAEDAQAAAETAAQTATEKAQQSAQNASQAASDADRAESAANRAETAETGAESAKTAAETAAQGAADSASAASTSATSAGQAATSAGQSATAAAGSATTAENAAQTATTKAGEASASATAAAASETAAQTAQAGAETAATNAGQSASTATAKAAEAATSASNAAASESAAEAAATRAEQAAASLTVDSALSDTSVNPVQNKVVMAEFTQVKSALKSVATGDVEKIYPTFQLGYLHNLPNNTPSNPGHIGAGDTSVCTTDYISVDAAQKLYFDDANYKLLVCYYNAQKTYQTYTDRYATTSPYVLDNQYAYCVPELKKTDNTVFDSAPVNPLYYNNVFDVDIVRHDELSAVESVTSKKIQPTMLPTIPLDVYRTVNGYSCELPYENLDGYTKIYVDSANGNDSNTGTSASPVKSLTKAVQKMQATASDTVIEIADGSVFYTTDIPTSCGTTKNLIIRSSGRATIFSGLKPVFTQETVHYVSEALTDYTIMGCVNTGDVDADGFYRPMTAVSSAADVDTTDNSYYIDSTNKKVYVNPGTQITDIVVLFSDYFVINVGANSLSASGFVMLENLTFVGNSTFTGRAAGTVGESIIRTAYAKNCMFEHAFTNNCLSFNDFEYSYVVGCKSGYCKSDCYNYHYTKKPTPTAALVVEVNCFAKEAGYYNANDASDNLTTCHEGANVLRCGCQGYNANGAMCADVNGCYSVCIDCTFVNTSYNRPSGANRSAYLFDNASATRNGKSMMQNCYGYDSRNNKLVSAVDLILSRVNIGGSIEATNITVCANSI